MDKERFDDLHTALAEHVHMAHCPFCGSDSWERTLIVGVMLARRITDTQAVEEGLPTDGSAEMQGEVPTIAMCCRGCGFLRLHLPPH